MPKKERVIRVFIEPMQESSYWLTRLVEGVKTFAQRKKLHIVQYDPESSELGLTMLVGTAESWLIEQTRLLEESGERVFLVNSCIPAELEGRHSVSFALEQAVSDTVRYLVSLGSKRPALIGINGGTSADKLKRRRFIEECERLRLDAICPEISDMRLIDQIESFTNSLPRIHVDALFCSNDTAAILMRSRISSKCDIPIVGMGNSYLGRRLDPPLTTVDFDYFKLGYEAARIYTLACELSGANPTVISASLPTKLIVHGENVSEPELDRLKPETITSAIGVANRYFTGHETERIINLENYLQSCDHIDRELIFGVRKSYSQLSEELYISERMLKYRMAKILTALGLESKSELDNNVRSIITPENH